MNQDIRRAPSELLRIALLAPHTRPVPSAQGGIQAVILPLTDELVRRGHSVELFAPPGSRSSAVVRPLLHHAYPNGGNRSIYEADHVARAFAAIEASDPPFDVVHDHSGYVALAMADRLAVPMVHTMHWHLNGDPAGFYAQHGHKARLVAISQSQLDCGAGRCRRAEPPNLELDASVVWNGLDVWPVAEEKEDYLLFVGRMTRDKGPHRAIEVARLSGLPLVLAGPVPSYGGDYFEGMVRPHLGTDGISWVGEIAGEQKWRLFSRARALVLPIRWCEPFGLVMLEAMSVGTPAIAFDEGAAREIIVPGVSGYLVDDVPSMADAARRAGEIDPHACRAVAERFSVGAMTDRYEEIYRQVARR